MPLCIHVCVSAIMRAIFSAVYLSRRGDRNYLDACMHSCVCVSAITCFLPTAVPVQSGRNKKIALHHRARTRVRRSVSWCPLDPPQEENAKLCDVFMRWLLGEAGVRFPRRRDYEVSESRRVPNTESLADRLRCCLQVQCW